MVTQSHKMAGLERMSDTGGSLYFHLQKENSGLDAVFAYLAEEYLKLYEQKVDQIKTNVI